MQSWRAFAFFVSHTLQGQGDNLLGSIDMKLWVVCDELHDGMPDLLGGKLPSALDKHEADVHIPFQVWVEPANADPSISVLWIADRHPQSSWSYDVSVDSQCKRAILSQNVNHSIKSFELGEKSMPLS